MKKGKNSILIIDLTLCRNEDHYLRSSVLFELKGDEIDNVTNICELLTRRRIEICLQTT